jgi:hypothetical protein
MKKRFFQVVGGGLLTIFFVALAEAPAGRAADSASSTQTSSPSRTPTAASTVTCDFSNPSYSGRCRLTKRLRQGVLPRGFCSQVLGCLNDTRCIRTYCNATTIRGGWKLESVEMAPRAP